MIYEIKIKLLYSFQVIDRFHDSYTEPLPERRIDFLSITLLRIHGNVKQTIDYMGANNTPAKNYN